MIITYPLIMSAIGLLAFKGIGTGILAVGLISITALKSLLEHKKSSYEYVSLNSPVWSRSDIGKKLFQASGKY